jgi:uncharacterized protein (TIGR00251 family)
LTGSGDSRGRIASNGTSGSASGATSGAESGAGQQLDIVAKDGCVVFQVRVQPRASRDEVAGVVEGALKIRIQAPAVENRANEAVCEYLATLLKTPKSAVRILGGERSRVKRVEIRGVQPREILALLSHEA